ncbi:MAG: fibronectin type III domain-containing protein [Prevotellaceae bacterium]|jgi:hypothetical protein|nr:fibronectin type III domain-containing protein [Prevotellaceae bacterium]
MKNIFSKLMVVIAASAFLFACDDKEPLPGSPEYDRLFSPTGVSAVILNSTHADITWKNVDGAELYVVEIYTGKDIFEPANLVLQNEVTGNRYSFDGQSDMTYTVRVMAKGEKADSKWYSNNFTTLVPDAFLPYILGDIGADFATMHWDNAVTEAVKLVFTANDGSQSIDYELQQEDIAAGEATVTELQAGTAYTVVLYAGDRRYARREITTLADGTIVVNEGEDLKQIIADAPDGATIICAPGVYATNKIVLSKSITLMGFGADYMPVIEGQLECSSEVSAITVKWMVFDGNGIDVSPDDDAVTKLGQFFNVGDAACNLDVLTIDGCEIRDYNNNFLYNNKSGAVNTIVVTNSLVHHIYGSGGDYIDWRGGTLGKLDVNNTTFHSGSRAFLRMQVECDAKFVNCTMYKIANLDNSNNSGLFRMSGGGKFEVSKCLFVETGVDNPTNASSGNFCKNSGNMILGSTESPVYSSNIVWSCYNIWVGLYTDPGQVGATEVDPGFADAENGDFHVANTAVRGIIGDPRWW